MRIQKLKNSSPYKACYKIFFPVLILCNVSVVLLSCSKETHEGKESQKPASSPTNGREIIERVNSRQLGKDSIKNVTMRLISADGTERRREMVVYHKSTSMNIQTLYLFTVPQNLNGIALLIHEPRPSLEGRGEGRDYVWLYLPAFDKIFEIQNPYRGHNILGTDISYEDSKQFLSLTDYTYKFLREERLNENLCSVVEGLPKSNEVLEETGYSRTLWWVRNDIWMILKAEYFDNNERLLKTYRAEKIKKIRNIWTSHLITMENQQTQHKTILEIEKVQYNRGLSKALFDRDSLRQWRER